jgi:hypothetical protein
MNDWRLMDQDNDRRRKEEVLFRRSRTTIQLVGRYDKSAQISRNANRSPLLGV